MRTDPSIWILARSSGLVAYGLLTASILVGIVLKARPFDRIRPARVTDLHRFLAFLGLGLSDSWGKMISEGAGTASLASYPWQILFPGLMLAVTLFSLNFLGDGVRDAMDPQLRGKR